MPDGNESRPGKAYTRREALAAMAKYSAAVGGSAVTIVTAEGLVSAASAYPPDDALIRFCIRNPTHRKCVGVVVPSGRIAF